MLVVHFPVTTLLLAEWSFFSTSFFVGAIVLAQDEKEKCNRILINWLKTCTLAHPPTHTPPTHTPPTLARSWFQIHFLCMIFRKCIEGITKTLFLNVFKHYFFFLAMPMAYRSSLA